MKKLAAVAGATLLSLGGGVAVADTAYPPLAGVLTLSPSTVAPGGTFTATLTGCNVGETVNFTVEGDSDSATSGATGGGSSRAPSAVPGGSASVALTAPSAEGEYPVTGTCATSGVTGTATLTVAVDDDDDDDGDGDGTGGGGTGVLPATGSDNDGTLQIAGGALVAGLALIGVAYKRRRTQTA